MDFPYFVQKRQRWFINLKIDETLITGRAQVGSPMGDRTSPKEFLGPFHETVHEWQGKQPVAQKRLFLECPALFEGKVDGSIATFADDIWKKLGIPTGLAARAEQLVDKAADALDTALAKKNMAQNRDKLVILPKLRSLRENRSFSTAKHEYQTKRVHRYLGTQYTAMSSNQHEITLRIRAANRGWQELHGLWFDSSVTY